MTYGKPSLTVVVLSLIWLIFTIVGSIQATRTYNAITKESPIMFARTIAYNTALDKARDTLIRLVTNA